MIDKINIFLFPINFHMENIFPREMYCHDGNKDGENWNIYIMTIGFLGKTGY